MIKVFDCIVGEHNISLVLLAAVVCFAGSWVTVRLFVRAKATAGAQRFGWHFLTAVAGGASIWCTHFIAMLGYKSGAPVVFDPVLTIMSLLIAIGGTFAGVCVGASRLSRLAPMLGGALVGLAISAMHYTGMAGYRVDGLVQWNEVYVGASVLLAALFGALTLDTALRPSLRYNRVAATGLLVVAIVSLHFTAMTAFQVTPMTLSDASIDAPVMQAMAMAIAVVGLIVVGAGLSSYLIDSRTRSDSYERLRHMALHDALTGLPNRTNFNEYLEQTIDLAGHYGRQVAVVGIDLDRFKEINDLKGHSAGDDALRALAQRMRARLGDGEFVARVGGDEFAAIKEFDDRGELVDFLGRLEAALWAPVRIGEFEIVTGASLGVAIYPADAEHPDPLVNNADLAMYRAKSDATQKVCFYDPSMDEAVRAQRALVKDLQRAVANAELELHYQVQTAISTGEACGYEALLRWSHPERGPIPPSEFIPIAEENGLIHELGAWVLHRACAATAAWEAPYKVAVNLSPVQFADADLPTLIHETLLATGLAPWRLELELTESTLVRDTARSLHILRRIKALGVSIALDDFGTGYSSLGTLRTFPFDKIKLDRSFMSEVETSAQAKAIIRAVLALGRSLDVPVLAEGIVTERQFAILQAEGCDEAQGYLLGRPAALPAGAKRNNAATSANEAGGYAPTLRPAVGSSAA